MEEVPQVLGGNQGVIARIDHLLEALLGTAPILVENLGLAQEGITDTCRDLVCTRFIVLALAGFQVGDGGLKLGYAPVDGTMIKSGSFDCIRMRKSMA